jgi:hypothetical protein
MKTLNSDENKKIIEKYERTKLRARFWRRFRKFWTNLFDKINNFQIKGVKVILLFYFCIFYFALNGIILNPRAQKGLWNKLVQLIDYII